MMMNGGGYKSNGQRKFCLFLVLFFCFLYFLACQRLKVQRQMLLADLKQYYLLPPSPLPTQFREMVHLNYTQKKDLLKLRKIVVKLLNRKVEGFFVEAGAFNGIDISNTAFLEKRYNWTGLLIEPDPAQFEQLANHHRHSWLSQTCLGIHPYPYPEKMTMSTPVLTRAMTYLTVLKSDESENNNSSRPTEEFQAQCFPLIDYLEALKFDQQDLSRVVDYLSLDLEGAELAVLETIPWHQVSIKVISVEFSSDQEVLKNFMRSKNYIFVDAVVGPWIHDHIYVHKDYAQHLTEVKLGLADVTDSDVD